MKPNFLKGLLRRVLVLLRYIWRGCVKMWNWYRRTYKQARWYGKVGIVCATVVVSFVLYLILVDINFLWLFGKSPSLYDIAHPKQDEASIVYSADGKVLGRYYRENRIPVEYDEISPMLINALVSTEDERFYSHHGIDFQGVAAAMKDMAVHHEARGASTITQQLVKNMFRTRTEYSTGLTGFIPGVRLLVMKTKEWVTAVKLEMFYTKKEILTMYLNTVDFGSNAFGIRTAAKTYFNTTPMKLKTEESAVLVGMLKATTTYNPRLNPKNSKSRRNVVLSNLLRKKFLTHEEYDSLSELPIELKYTPVRPTDGKAPYFRDVLADELQNGWCKDNDKDLYGDGLRIYTTIDSRMQKYAEEAVMKHMQQVQRNFKSDWGNENPWRDENREEKKGFIEDIAKRTDYYKQLSARYPDDPDSVNYYMNLPHRVKLFDYNAPDQVRTEMMSAMDSIRYMVKFLHCAFVAMEPETGAVKAWVGDIDYNHWQYDKVTAERQPGSTFKLCVYTAAMEAGLGPCDDRVDEWKQYDAFDKDGKPTKWTPRNANGYYTGGAMSLKHAFSNSINSVAVSVAHEVGLNRVADVGHKLGIMSPIKETPAMPLGTEDVTLLELVDAYCTVMNKGRHNVPEFVTRIEDKDGKVLYVAEPKNEQAISEESAFLMQQMLLAGMTEPGGTSQALWSYDIHHFDTNFGGKTGTTSNNSDGWYVGVTKNLVAGCWCGGEYRSVHFRSGRMGQGSHTALPAFGYFMEKVLRDPQLAAKYRGKISDKPWPGLRVDDRPYNCQGYVAPSDTTDVDSTDVEDIDLPEEEIELDNNGNEIPSEPAQGNI